MRFRSLECDVWPNGQPDPKHNYRSVCVSINYLAQNRPDILFAPREMARWMSQPNTMAWEMAKRDVVGSCWASREHGAEIRDATFS